MRRLPWERGFPAHYQSDGGGLEELQTDVMRFMAILAFCLVAIFALVQSIPLGSPSSPDVAADTPPNTSPNNPPIEPQELSPPEAPLRKTAPTQTPPRDRQETVPLTPRPVPDPAPLSPRKERLASLTRDEATETSPLPSPRHSEPTEPTPIEPTTKPPLRESTESPAESAAQPPTSEPQTPTQTPSRDIGFSLRFESDQALRALVARGDVALYAFASDKAWRMLGSGERLTFQPSQTPTRFHIMTRDTVPTDVVNALRRTYAVGSPGAVTWGVTLPAETTQQLGRILQSRRGGELVIQPDGRLRLEAA